MRTKLYFAFVVVAGAAAAGGTLSGCGEEPVPLVITYKEHVQPLLAARCIRCHGAGGALNRDPEISQSFVDSRAKTDPAGTVPGSIDHRVPQDALLNIETVAKSYAGGFGLYLKYPMPPPPFPSLTERETQILLDWTGI